MSLIGREPLMPRPSVARPAKLKVYRSFRIEIYRDGTWVEANVYDKRGHLRDHLGSGTYGPGVYDAFFRKGERSIDAMHGD